MNPIFLDKQDIFTLWDMNGDRQAEEPFKHIKKFLNYYKIEHHDEYVPDMFEYNYSNKRGNTHHSVKLDFLADFAQFFDSKIKVNENFICLINCLPRDTKTSSTVKYFKYMNDKYPDFFNQVTQAMDQKNIIAYHENNIVAGWISLVVENKAQFKNQKLFSFMEIDIHEKEATLVKKINILNRFDLDKTLGILDTTLRQNEKNPAIINAVANYYKQNNIAHSKVEIPIFEVSEQRLFHLDMKFQPEGVMQKLNVKEKDARNILIWACYYLGEHAYHGVVNERTNGEEANASYDKPISLRIITPYEHALQDAKPIYDEALQILFNSDFLTSERIKKLQHDRYDENIAKEFKAFIKPAKLQQELSSRLVEKEYKNPKMKI